MIYMCRVLNLQRLSCRWRTRSLTTATMMMRSSKWAALARRMARSTSSSRSTMMGRSTGHGASHSMPCSLQRAASHLRVLCNSACAGAHTVMRVGSLAAEAANYTLAWAYQTACSLLVLLSPLGAQDRTSTSKSSPLTVVCLCVAAAEMVVLAAGTCLRTASSSQPRQ